MGYHTLATKTVTTRVRLECPQFYLYWEHEGEQYRKMRNRPAPTKVGQPFDVSLELRYIFLQSYELLDWNCLDPNFL